MPSLPSQHHTTTSNQAILQQIPENGTIKKHSTVQIKSTTSELTSTGLSAEPTVLV
jgi:hypothetical protein